MKPFRSFLSKLGALFLVLFLLAGVLFAVLPLPGTIPVLMYHFVNEGGNDYGEGGGNFVTRESFERQMAFLKKFGYRVISLDDYHAILTGAKKPAGREIVITFDDGDFSFAKFAVPVLEKYQFPVAMFLVSDLIKTGEQGSMKLEVIKQLQADHPWINFQSHSKSHPHFLEISPSLVEEEMSGSKRELSEMLGKPIRYFAYPFGEFNASTLRAAEEAGYALAFTTGHKRLKGIRENLRSITRIKIDRHSESEIVFWYYLSGLHQMIKGTREKFRNLSIPEK